jgi:hypothetical protein
VVPCLHEWQLYSIIWRDVNRIKYMLISRNRMKYMLISRNRIKYMLISRNRIKCMLISRNRIQKKSGNIIGNIVGNKSRKCLRFQIFEDDSNKSTLHWWTDTDQINFEKLLLPPGAGSSVLSSAIWQRPIKTYTSIILFVFWMCMEAEPSGHAF